MNWNYTPNHNPPRGVAYTLRFGVASGNFINNLNTYIDHVYVSIDGGAWSGDLFDNLTLVSRGLVSLPLTAEQMDGEVIAVEIMAQAAYMNDVNAMLFIYTSPQELSAMATKTSTLQDKMQALYQYFIHKRDMTTAVMKLYKDDGAAIVGSCPVSDDGTTKTKGKII